MYVFFPNIHIFWVSRVIIDTIMLANNTVTNDFIPLFALYKFIITDHYDAMD